MSEKIKLALYWGAACGGCDVSVLDTNAKVLDVAAIADIVLWPVAMDGKYNDVEELPDESIDVCLFNGGVRNSETEEIAKLLRAKSKVVVAFGACACIGGLPGMANLSGANDLLRRVYETCETVDNPAKIRPQISTETPDGSLQIPALFERVYPLDEVVRVDYYLPGCPATAEWVARALDAIASGGLPEPPAVIGIDKTLCDECPRERAERRSIERLFRPHEIISDPARCLLEQGIVCCGPATRGGCGARCVAVNMPCRGCYGPPPGVADQGAKMLSAVASLVAAEDEEGIDRIIGGVRDSIGTFCPFSVPKSISQAARRAA